MNEKYGFLISQSDIDRHNREEGQGRWLVINGKVYDVEPLAMQVSIVALKFISTNICHLTGTLWG